jgi:hypothetical protein
MELEIARLYSDIKESFKKNYLQEIKKNLKVEVQQMIHFVDETKSFHAKKDAKSVLNKEIVQHKLNLQVFLNETWKNQIQKEFAVTYEELCKAQEVIFESTIVSEIKEQSSKRFFKSEDDSSRIKLLKFFKKGAFKCSRFPIHVLNLFVKDKRVIRYWEQSIPVKNLAIRCFKIEATSKLRSITDHFFKDITHQYCELKAWEESLNGAYSEVTYQEVFVRIAEFEIDLFQKITTELNHVLDACYKTFLSSYEKVGTIEYPNNDLTDEGILRLLNEAQKNWSNHHHSWGNTLFAFFEEWRSDIDIYILKHKSLAELEEFKQGQIRQLETQIDPEINAIELFIKEAIKTLSLETDNLPKELKRLNYEAIKKLDKELVPRLCDKISGRKFTNLINKLELEIRRGVEDLSEEHVIVKDTTFESPTKDDDLHKISLHELIAFETLISFQSQLGKVKAELFNSLESITIIAQDLDHVITYAFSSSIAALEDEGKSDKDATNVASEGLKRALARLEDTKLGINDAIAINNTALASIVNQFCGSILELTTNDNIRELRLRITRARTSKQAGDLKNKLIEKLKSRSAAVFLIAKSTFSLAKIGFHNARERFVLTAKKPALTKEVSNFLLESQEIVNQLPLVYRRLYRIEPLDDLELFEGRNEEQQHFKEAFESWTKGRFASTAILGEKWGGLTSFLNYVLGNTSFKHPITRISPKENIYSAESFIEFLKTALKNESFENVEDVIDFLNSGVKRIIILENSQNLYLRKVGGFEALKTMFQLVTRTNKNIFWVTTATLYTWSYLSKTIRIQEFFSYVIQLGELKDEQIVDIILKRNRISGFSIQFDAGENRKEDRKFNNMKVSDQQVVLQDEFFSDLNEFAKSNVSMALIFWLLSTKKVDKQSITMGVFNKPDFNFLTMLSMDKIQTLHALILHDGLKEAQLAQVLHLSLMSSRLTLLALLEDGILLRDSDIYSVNPILYRNTISLLKTRNLIH